MEKSMLKTSCQRTNLKCRFCDFESNYSLISHITRKHKMKMCDYRLKYPLDVVQRHSKKTKELLATKAKLWFKNDENYDKYKEKLTTPAQNKHWTNQGYSLEEAKLKVSIHQSKASLSTSQSKRKEMGIAMEGQSNPMSLSSIAKRNNCSLDEAKKLTPCYGRVGIKHPMFGKNHSPEVLKKIAKNTPIVFSRTSKGEIEMANFIENSIASMILKNHQVGRYNCDVVIPDKKIIVEYFGDKWHMNPDFYSENDKHFRTSHTAKHWWDRDRIKVEYLKSLGYEVIIIWASKWKIDKTKSELINRINKNATN